jgi:hypothetical protein
MEIMEWDIFFKAVIIGLAGFSYLIVSKSIELSIQDLKYSYNFNLFIVGVSNLFGFISASNFQLTKFTSSGSSSSEKEDSSTHLLSTESLQCCSYSPSAKRMASFSRSSSSS